MFITIHILRAIPMHNLNRDQNGLPKSQFDGGVQRGRLSSQSLKRPARIRFLASTSQGSIRTKQAPDIVNGIAAKWAASHNLAYDSVEGLKRAKAIIGSVFKSAKKAESNPESDAKDTILLFSMAELETLARAIVEAQNEQRGEPSLDDFIQDHRSPSLDIAAFGRMFAQRSDLSTQAAVAASHAVTTHPMALTIDYFTAVDETPDSYRSKGENGGLDAGAGAAHLGLAYFTSGVYYNTFTIDTDQLRRSWSGIDGETAHDQLVAMSRAMIEALPTGRLTNSNAHTNPYLVLVEPQKARHVYDFETPVRPSDDGGYKAPSAKALAGQRQLALRFDAESMGEALVWGDTYANDFAATVVADINELASRIADLVLNPAPTEA